jgi:hypothetical protein
MMLAEKRNLLTSFIRGEAEEFCRFFACSNPITIQAYDRKRPDKSLARIVQGTFSDLDEKLVEPNSRGAGIRLMVNEGDSQGRQAENVVSIRAFFLGLDSAPLDPARSPPIPQKLVLAVGCSTRTSGPPF